MTENMRLLVCGGRDFTDYAAVCRALDQVNEAVGISAIIHGAARGADSLGARWAQERGILTVAFPADWNKRGKGAGHIRNQQMLDEGCPEGVVAFPGGTGTADMIRRAKRFGLKVWEPCNAE